MEQANQQNRLCDSDYRFMQIVWEYAPIKSGELAVLCEKELGWKKSTTYTVIKKLCEKGFIQNQNALVSVLIPREKVQASETEYFVERTFAGSLPGFLTAFLGERTLSEKEAERLKKLIDEHKG